MVIGYGSSDWFKPESRQHTPFTVPPISQERPRRTTGVYIEWGPELPQHYHVDRVAVMIRDPFWVCIYWFLEGSKSTALLERFGKNAQLLLVLECADSVRYEYSIPRECPYWWVKLEPGRYYTAKIRLVSGSTSIEICATRPFRTPRPWIKILPEGTTYLVHEFAEKFGYPIGSAEALVFSLFPAGAFITGEPPETPPTDAFHYPMPTSREK